MRSQRDRNQQLNIEKEIEETTAVSNIPPGMNADIDASKQAKQQDIRMFVYDTESKVKGERGQGYKKHYVCRARRKSVVIGADIRKLQWGWDGGCDIALDCLFMIHGHANDNEEMERWGK
jgi:hypothetical protein